MRLPKWLNRDQATLDAIEALRLRVEYLVDANELTRAHVVSILKIVSAPPVTLKPKLTVEVFDWEAAQARNLKQLEEQDGTPNRRR